MDVSSARAVNHHADYPGFAGVTGFLIGLVMAVMGRANAPAGRRCDLGVGMWTVLSTSVAARVQPSEQPPAAGRARPAWLRQA